MRYDSNATIDNMNIVLSDAMNDVHSMIKDLQIKYKITVAGLMDYLRYRTPELAENIILAQDRVDTDIFGKIINGTATVGEIKEWERSVGDLRNLFEEGINTFAEQQPLSYVA